jgi:hypothetical protein
MNEKRHRHPEGNVMRLLRHGAKQNSIHENSAAQVEQDIENMIAGDGVTIE